MEMEIYMVRYNLNENIYDKFMMKWKLAAKNSGNVGSMNMI